MVLLSTRPTEERLASDVDHQGCHDAVLFHLDPRGDGCCLVVVSSQCDGDGACLVSCLMVVFEDVFGSDDFPVVPEDTCYRIRRHPRRDEVDLDLCVPVPSPNGRCDFA